MRRILPTLLCFLATTQIFAQQLFSGKIIDSESKVAISHVYIENTTRHIIAESNSSGFFDIFTHPGDTLVFSSIGYFWAKHIVTNDNNLIFNLSPQIYEIGTVTKYFPYSYEELTNKVLNMKPIQDTFHLNLEQEKYLPINNHQPGQLSYTISGAITEFYNSTNRHARNAIKAAELLSHKENILIINKKINKKMIMEMTNIPESYFDKFIAFCNFSDEFLVHTSDFQIIMTVCWEYERFLDIYPELKNSLN
ncbi:MAG: carboxypeptidase-like regulatory domain-containing protein [Bacteroidales bacterium]|nr:carboxypeptidase-like regulatory domain-containing protein [Bacteroidales bacterium]